MIEEDEDALICDLAETYGIFEYRALPARRVATLAVGLRDDARIKMKMSGMRVPVNTMLLGSIADANNLSVWQRTKDGQKGRNRPESILEAMTATQKAPELEGFDSFEEFDAWRNGMLKGK